MTSLRDPFSTPEADGSQASFQPYRDMPGHSINPDNEDYFDAAAIPVSDTNLDSLTLLFTCRFFLRLSFTSNSALQLANVVFYRS